NPTRQRGECSGTLAGASGSTSQTTTIVTPSPHAIVSAQALLELARWCRQQLANMEESHLCPQTNITQESPPAQAQHAALPDDSSLARAGAPTANRPADPLGRAAAPTPPSRRSRRNGGGR